MKRCLMIAMGLCIGSMMLAHEYVLLAHTYRLQKGDSLELHLFVADGFNVQLERPLQKSITRKFELISENGVTDLLTAGKDQSFPLLHHPVNFEGLGLIHMERDYARISLTTNKFREYLKEDHLDNIIIPKGSEDKPQRERYSRYLKSLVVSGTSKGSELYKKIVGQNFEIILLQDPYLLHKGNSLQAKIFFKGKPLANKVVTARNRIGSEVVITSTAKTNFLGICTFKIVRKGEWFIHATQMIPCPDKADSDWESFWTSYSFQID